MTTDAGLISWSGETAAWIGLVGEAAARGTLLLLAALLIAILLRRSSAASRHLVWASCLFLLLTLPLLARISPAVPAPVIPATWSAAWHEATEAAGSAIEDFLGNEEQTARPTMTATVVGPLGHIDAGDVDALSVQLASPEARVGAELAAAGWLTAIWLTGASLVLCWLAIGLGLRRALSHHAHVVSDGPWIEAAREIAAQLGIKRDLVLLRGEEDAVPMTWGSLRPVVYLPPGADDWAADQCRSVLLHELAHVRRWDSLTRSISQLACAIFWFHPLAWYAAHRLLREQERACDDVVLLAGAAPDEYATTLLTLARHYRQRRLAVVGALALARRSTLENRLISILDPRRKRIKMSRTHRCVLLATFVSVVIPLASLQPAPAEPALASTQSAIASGNSRGETAPSPQAAASSSSQATATSVTAEEADPVKMIVKGVVHLGSTLNEIEVGPGGHFVIQEVQSVEDHLELESADSERGRRLEITADGDGNVERAWTVDGVTQRLDAEARSWIDGILGRLSDAHLELEPGSPGETHTMIFAGEKMALVGEAHASTGASSHGALAVTEGDRVVHVKPGMVWTTEEGDQSTIDIHISELHVDDDSGELTIHISDPEALLLEGEAGESIVLKLERGEGDKSFSFVTTKKLTVVGEGDERKVHVVVPKGEIDEQKISVVVVNPKLEIVEEGGEARAVIVVEPKTVTEATGEHRVHVEIVDEPHVVVDVRTDEHSEHTITLDIDDEDSHMTVRMRGEVDLADTVDEIEVGEGGELSIDERDADGVVRQLSIRPGAEGNLLFEFFVDGTERPFDAAARAWFQGVLDRIET